MAENLNVEYYRNGDIIPQVQDEHEWASLKTGAWCYYENDPANGKKYGKLYNWYAVNDTRGLVPEGWHIPSYSEWRELIEYLGEDSAGTKMKSTSGWFENGNGTNSSGFGALGAGYRYVVHREYLIFYKVLGAYVRVYRVLHGRRMYRDIL